MMSSFISDDVLASVHVGIAVVREICTSVSG